MNFFAALDVISNVEHFSPAKLFCLVGPIVFAGTYSLSAYATEKSSTAFEPGGTASVAVSSRKDSALAPDAIDKSDLPYKYWGNSFSGKFHRPSCPFGKAMNTSHLELYHFRCEAVASGKTPCRYCLPPTWRSVSCVLLKPKSNSAVNMADHKAAAAPTTDKPLNP